MSYVFLSKVIMCGIIEQSAAGQWEISEPSLLSDATAKCLQQGIMERRELYLAYSFGGCKSKIGQPCWFSLW